MNRKEIFTALIIFAFYILLAILSIKYVTMSSGIAIAWLPNSILLAFFLIKEKKKWKYFIPFFILAEIIADYPTFTIIQALQFSIINISETMMSAIIIKKISTNERKNFSSTKYVLAFILIGLTLMPALSGILGAIVYYTQIDINTSLVEFWRLWFFGNAIGILLLTPLIVLFIEKEKTLKIYDFNMQNIGIIIASGYLAIELFSNNAINFVLPTTPLLFILLLLWVVYKQGIFPGLIYSFLIAVIAIYYTSDAMGPFSIFAEKETTIYLQEYIALLFIITLFFGILHKEINDSNKKLAELNKTLEEKIEEKTQSLVQANKKLNQLASKDSLTNIYNRRMMDKFISLEVEKAKRYKHSLSLIMVDIDNFKEVNDKFGHQVGDEVIVKLVEILSRNIRKSDILGRWGGEEFIILLPETNIKEAYLVAENLRKKVENHTFEKVGTKTMSLGISELKFDENILEFIKSADDAMYKAKRSGKNKVMSS